MYICIYVYNTYIYIHIYVYIITYDIRPLRNAPIGRISLILPDGPDGPD